MADEQMIPLSVLRSYSPHPDKLDLTGLTQDEITHGIKSSKLPDYIRYKQYLADTNEALAQLAEMIIQFAVNLGLDPDQTMDWARKLQQALPQSEFDSWVATLLDGGPSIFMNTLGELQAKYPNGAAGVALVRETDPAKIYVWNGTAWEDFGDFQGIEIKDGTITSSKIADGVINRSKINYYVGKLKNIFTIDGYQPDSYYVYNSGAVSSLSGWNTTKMLPVYPGEKYESNINGQITFWSKGGDYVSGQNNGTTISPIVIPQNVYGMRHAIKDEVIENPEKYHITGETNFEDPQLIVKASQIEDLESIIPKSKYDGKIIANLGDSITDFNNVVRYDILTVGYQHYLETELGCTTVELAKSGHTMQQIYTDYVVPNNFENYDAVTLFAGTNNYAQNQESSLGDVLPTGSNFDTATFTGAYQKAIEKIYSDKPDMRIYLIIPQKGWYTSYLTPNGVASDMTTAIPDKIIEIAELYNLPVLDLYRHSGINRLTAGVYINDGTNSFRFHPSNEGYKK
ncbi:SGNH/GDSL hydrolase family protein [Aerococcus urinaeequi]|uniref:SGNH/GDSL hydrolase family protein n=1 Tax=Aerococcus urinaeequi TaxID=51665 RepID=UPI003AAF80A5